MDNLRIRSLCGHSTPILASGKIENLDNYRSGQLERTDSIYIHSRPSDMGQMGRPCRPLLTRHLMGRPGDAKVGRAPLTHF